MYALALALVGCAPDGGDLDAELALVEGKVVSEFSLEDVNPNSSTYGTELSPQSQLGKVSAWYFGHTT